MLLWGGRLSLLISKHNLHETDKLIFVQRKQNPVPSCLEKLYVFIWFA